MKTGCGKPVTKGHGEVAVCGKDFYGEIYTCDSCLKLRVAELEAALRECREAMQQAKYSGTPYRSSYNRAIAKINEVLK